ncbi:MAG: BON domain-containing protein [Ktedonobacterales bacterium]
MTSTTSTTSTNQTSNDEHIQQLVLEELDWDPRVSPSEVGVSVKGGIVTLRGVLDSYTKRLAAQEAALNVLGVRAVANEIEVHVPSSAERTDADLAQIVLAALAWDADIPSDRLEIVVSHGWVTLQGVVDVPFQRQEAERVVHHLAAVKGVINRITVLLASPAPKDVRERIERALLRNAETDSQNITVQVSGDKVVLQGRVRSYAELRAAEGAALSAPGIVEVANHLVVAPPA